MKTTKRMVFVLQDDQSGPLMDIQPGNHVTLTYVTPNGTPTAVQIAQTSSEFTGTLTAINLNERTVEAQSLFTSKKFNVADDCAIVINGKTDGKLANLMPDEKLDFSYNDINGVNVVNRIAPAQAKQPESQPNPVVTTVP